MESKVLCTFPYCKRYAIKRGTRGKDDLWEYALCSIHKDLLNPYKKTPAQVPQRVRVVK